MVWERDSLFGVPLEQLNHPEHFDQVYYEVQHKLCHCLIRNKDRVPS